MKTLEEIKEEYAKELGYESWWELSESVPGVEACDYIVNEIAKRYADECAREALRFASHSVRPKEFRFYDDYERCEQSILSETNLPSHK